MLLAMSLFLAQAALPEGATCLWSKTNPKGPKSYELPVAGQSGEALLIDWFVEEEPVGVTTPAALVTIRFQGGKENIVRAMPGTQVSTHPMTSQDLQALAITVAGKPAWSSRQTIALASRSPIERVTVASRLSDQTLCVLKAQLQTSPLPNIYRTDISGWYPFAVPRYVKAPLSVGLPVEPMAGSRGFVSVDANGNLRFSDGTRARFWGTNLMGVAGLPEKSEAENYAKTLARLGFNLARIHHVDKATNGIVDPNRSPSTDPFNEERLDQLDWFIAKLQEQGIYIWAEVATTRAFTEADGVSVPQDAPQGHKLYPMWEPDWETAYLRWFEQYWGRTNPYTKKNYTNDPGIAVLELTNEHSLLLNWGAGIESLHPVHLANLTKKWNEWLKRKYGSDAAVAAAWKGSVNPGIGTGESIETGTVLREPSFIALVDRYPDQRRADLGRFYWELEEAFFQKLKAKAEKMGFKVPVVPTIHYNNPMLQTLHADSKMADIHVYYDKGGDNSVDGNSALAEPGYPLSTLSGAMYGSGMAVSELTHGFPTPFRAESPWLWTTLASVQDWDVLIWSFWSEGVVTEDPTLDPHRPDLRTNPVVLTQLPAASSAFRAGWIPSATGLFPLQLNRSVILERLGILGITRPLELQDLPTVLSKKIRTVVDRELAPVEGTPVPGVGWWAQPGVLLLDQPQLQVRVGPPGALARGAGDQALSRLEVAVDDFAAVALVSADGKPLEQSRLATLTLLAYAENTGQSWTAYKHSLRSPGTAPILLSPLRGTVRFAWTGTPIVEVLGAEGQPTGTLVPVKGSKGWWTLDTSTLTTPWLLIRSKE